MSTTGTQTEECYFFPLSPPLPGTQGACLAHRQPPLEQRGLHSARQAPPTSRGPAASDQPPFPRAVPEQNRRFSTQDRHLQARRLREANVAAGPSPWQRQGLGRAGRAAPLATAAPPSRHRAAGRSTPPHAAPRRLKPPHAASRRPTPRWRASRRVPSVRRWLASSGGRPCSEAVGAVGRHMPHHSEDSPWFSSPRHQGPITETVAARAHYRGRSWRGGVCQAEFGWHQEPGAESIRHL